MILAGPADSDRSPGLLTFRVAQQLELMLDQWFCLLLRLGRPWFSASLSKKRWPLTHQRTFQTLPRFHQLQTVAGK
jgi:hypothetical protein